MIKVVVFFASLSIVVMVFFYFVDRPGAIETPIEDKKPVFQNQIHLSEDHRFATKEEQKIDQTTIADVSGEKVAKDRLLLELSSSLHNSVVSSQFGLTEFEDMLDAFSIPYTRYSEGHPKTGLRLVVKGQHNEATISGVFLVTENQGYDMDSITLVSDISPRASDDIKERAETLLMDQENIIDLRASKKTEWAVGSDYIFWMDESRSGQTTRLSLSWEYKELAH